MKNKKIDDENLITEMDDGIGKKYFMKN